MNDKIVALTVCVADLYSGPGIECVGGNAVNFATQCRHSGVREVSVLGAVGTDRYGTMILEHLRNQGIDTSHLYIRKGATATHLIQVSASGERMFTPDGWQGGVYQTFRLTEADWAFVNSHTLAAAISVDPNFPALLVRLKPGVRLVVDFLDTGNFALLESALPRIDLAFLSGNRKTLDQARTLARARGAFLVVTMGAEGSVALRGQEEVFQPALPVERVVDTTGCGDAFQAAFTVAWLQARDLSTPLHLGAEAAARMLTHFGGV